MPFAMLVNRALDLVLPRFCVGCNREGVDFCDDCLHAMRPHTMVRRSGFRYLAEVVTLAPYGEPVVRNLIQAWKYDRVTTLFQPITFFVRRGIINLTPLLGADEVIPVPLHWFRERERGFNQAAMIAEAVGETLGSPVRGDILVRVRRTESQSKLQHGSVDRERNVAAAFGVVDPSSVLGKRCLLVDDVVTSGRTMDACAHALKKAGATTVIGFAIARG